MTHKFKVGDILKYMPPEWARTVPYEAYCKVVECRPYGYVLSDSGVTSLEFVHKTHELVSLEEQVALKLEGVVDV